jgi:ribosomal protein S18 acetylase RimI-like enzyme
MAKIILQKAIIEDIPKLLDIENKLVGLKTYVGETTKEEWLEEFDKGAVIYLILKDGEVVGDASYERKPDGSIYISGLAINPEFQGQGIGREVMSQIMEELRNEKVISIVTHPENTLAIRIYTSLGFVSGRQIENFYGDGQPRIELIRKME